jgi:hypothetical protein
LPKNNTNFAPWDALVKIQWFSSGASLGKPVAKLLAIFQIPGNELISIGYFKKVTR